MNRYGLTSKDRRLKATSLFLVLALSLSVTQAKSIVAPNDSSTGLLRQTLSVAGGAMIYQEPNTAWQVVAVGDLNGDHRDDLIWWNNVTGQVYGMLMNGVVRQQEGMLYREPDTAWRIVVARDITGDGQADLLWRNTNTGQVYLMPMNGLTIAGGAMIYHEPNLNWSIVAVGDLNNDQRDDLIWWYSNTGQVYGMLMNGYFISAQGMTYHEPNTAWQIISSGDYTGDGKADLLWRNSQTGQIYEMPMNGLAVAGGQQIYQEANANWRIVANAGVSFLPQPSRSLPGATRFAPLEGEPLNPYQPLEGEPLNPNLLSAQSLSSQTLTTFDVPQIKISPQFSPLSTNALLHSGDYNGDGKADLIWQNIANGQVYEILLDGFNIIQQGMIYHEPNTAWRIVGNGDFTGNGQSDLLWWNSSTGQVYLMTMGATDNPSPNTYTLTVNKTGTGSGAVTGAGINCGSNCTENYNQGATVTLIATAAAGSTFAGWSGACTNTTGNCVVSMTAAQSVIANFILGDPVTSLIFNDFSSVAGLTLNNTATSAYTTGGFVLRLTPASDFNTGSAFSTNKIRATNFSTFFMFRITNSGGMIADCNTETGADGLVFVIQNAGLSIVDTGPADGIGYAGINWSVGVEFDTWCNFYNNDPDSNHLGININGSVNHGIGSPNTLNVSPNFDDGNIWFAWIDYDGSVLEVRVNQTGIRPLTAMLTHVLDISEILGDTHAYVGFTSATGAAWGNHDIIRWEYRDLSGQDH